MVEVDWCDMVWNILESIYYCANICGCRKNRLEGSNWIPQHLFKLFNILCPDYLIFYNELCESIECYGLVDIIGYNELPKYYIYKNWIFEEIKKKSESVI
jgi:hypothetical protein